MLEGKSDPRAILGVSEGADKDAIKRAYRKLAKENHPDVCSDREAATKRMAMINAAFQQLCGPARISPQAQPRQSPKTAPFEYMDLEEIFRRQSAARAYGR